MKRGKLPHLVSISAPHVTCVYLCFPNSKLVVYDPILAISKKKWLVYVLLL